MVQRIVLICLLGTLPAMAWGQQPPDLRTLEQQVFSAFVAACESPNLAATVQAFESAAETFLQQSSETNLSQGLLATARIMLAESMINPLDKLNQFTTYKVPLEAAISADSDNPSLRLLRLSVQHSVPAFLGYFHEIEEDLEAVTRAQASGYWNGHAILENFVSEFLIILAHDHSE